MNKFASAAAAAIDLTDEAIQIAPTASMKRIDLADLPRWNVHAQRLLEGPVQPPRKRDFDSTRRDYDNLAYAPLLRHLDQIAPDATVHDIRRVQVQQGQRHRTPTEESAQPQHERIAICISLGDDLFEVDLDEAQSIQFDLVGRLAVQELGECRTIVDLGGGYGYLLHKLRQYFDGPRYWIGADGSRAAIELAKRLSADLDDMCFVEFNFYDPGSYDFLNEAQPPIGVITHHAIEQLPSAAAMMDALSLHRSSIASVLHFEPIYGPQDTTALGRLRRRYIENQDYNRDLLTEIHRRTDVRLVRNEPNVIGLNPLIPTSVLQWQFVD